MKPENRLIAKWLIEETPRDGSQMEVRITQKVAERLKRAKLGLFQNEVDYRVLAPGFEPPDHKGKRTARYRADLVGFSSDGFSVTEFKIYNESRNTKNPWGVLSLLQRDWRTLDELRTAHPRKLW